MIEAEMRPAGTPESEPIELVKSMAGGRTTSPKLFSFLAAIVFLLAALSRPVQAESLDLKMGNPSHARDDARDKDNFLMEKEYFALSYNNTKGTPNWVSWHLDASDLGTAPRASFHPDETLPRGFRRITPMDYTGSGFDRGHICPHSDRSASPRMSQATFVMSNIIPQSPHVNQKAWAQLEMYCRKLVESQHKTLYIVSGPTGQGGTGSEGPKDIIGKRLKVVVPAQCWKVIMVLDAGEGDDLKKVNEHTRLIAVIMPNDMTVGEDWSRFRVPVKSVEKLTGYRFFDRVPANIIEPLKEKTDDEHIPRARAIRHGPEK
ncbi:MAG: nucA [Pedosphaera sp.]|nr:nucA [Pedosphaera sp.]